MKVLEESRDRLTGILTAAREQAEALTKIRDKAALVFAPITMLSDIPNLASIGFSEQKGSRRWTRDRGNFDGVRIFLVKAEYAALVEAALMGYPSARVSGFSGRVPTHGLIDQTRHAAAASARPKARSPAMGRTRSSIRTAGLPRSTATASTRRRGRATARPILRPLKLLSHPRQAPPRL